jgi:hypothetical protein
MIQGVDPVGTGRGDVGYGTLDEIWPGARHARCVARGPTDVALSP